MTSLPRYHVNQRGYGAHQAIAEMVIANTTVLDVGCAAGYLMEHLARTKGCACVGIEPNPVAAAQASSLGFEVINASAEDALMTLDVMRRFDCLIFGDVLEHLQEPLSVLAESLELLNPDGMVVVSLPNVASLHARLRVACGIWRYEEMGIFDRTHLRFFTLRTARQLLEEAGLYVRQERFVGPLTFYGGRRLERATRLRPQVLANQMVFGARPRVGQ